MDDDDSCEVFTLLKEYYGVLHLLLLQSSRFSPPRIFLLFSCAYNSNAIIHSGPMRVSPLRIYLTFSESFWKHRVHTTMAKQIHPGPMRISAPQICLMSSCCKNTSTEPRPYLDLDHEERASALTQHSHAQYASGIFYNNVVKFRCAVDIRRQVPFPA